MVVTDLYIVQRATFPNFTADHTQEMEEELEEENQSILDIEFPIESDNQETDEEGGGNKVGSHCAPCQCSASNQN